MAEKLGPPIDREVSIRVRDVLEASLGILNPGSLKRGDIFIPEVSLLQNKETTRALGEFDLSLEFPLVVVAPGRERLGETRPITISITAKIVDDPETANEVDELDIRGRKCSELHGEASGICRLSLSLTDVLGKEANILLRIARGKGFGPRIFRELVKEDNPSVLMGWEEMSLGYRDSDREDVIVLLIKENTFYICAAYLPRNWRQYSGGKDEDIL